MYVYHNFFNVYIDFFIIYVFVNSLICSFSVIRKNYNKFS